MVSREKMVKKLFSVSFIGSKILNSPKVVCTHTEFFPLEKNEKQYVKSVIELIFFIRVLW